MGAPLKDFVMTQEELKRSAIIKIICFFAITIIIGFVASDINIMGN